MSRLSRLLIRVALVLCVAFLARTSRAGGDKEPRQLQLQTPPEAAVNSVAFSPDGSIVAAGGDVGGIRLYDAASGEMLRDIGGEGRSACFSPDGKLVAGAGFYMDKELKVYEAGSGRVAHHLPGKTVIESYGVAFSPDGRLFAAAGREDQQILVWDLSSDKLLYRLADGDFNPTAIAFSPDSQTLASGGGDRIVRLWDLKTGTVRQQLSGHKDWICTLTYSADGKRLATGSCDFSYHRGRDPARLQQGNPAVDSQWILWNTATAQPEKNVTVHGRMLSLDLSPDGKSLACGADDEVRLYHLTTDSPPRVIHRHGALVTGVKFARDGASLISSAHDRVVTRVQLSDGKQLWSRPGYYEQVNSLAISPDRALMVTGSSDGRFASRLLPAGSKLLSGGALRLWNLRTGAFVRRLGDPREQFMAVALSPSAQQVVGAGANPEGAGVVHCWDAESGEPRWNTADHKAEVLAAAFSSDGAMLATGSADGTVLIRDAQSGAVRQTLTGHAGGATSVAFTPDGSLLICGEGHGGTRVWNAKTGQLLHTGASTSRAASIKVDRMMTTICVAPDGHSYYSGNASMGNTLGERVRLWEIGNGDSHREVSTPGGFAGRPIALSPDGSLLAGGGKSVQLYDAHTGKTLQRLDGVLKKVQAIAFSADARLVVAGGAYGTTNVWDVSTGQLLVTLFTFCDPHDGQITDDWLAYRPSGVYSGSPGVERYLAWRVGDELQTDPQSGRRPDEITAALAASTK